MKRLELSLILVILVVSLLHVGVVRADTVEIHGSIRSSEGQPAEDVLVTFQDLNGQGDYGSTTTDSAGHYSFHLERPERLDVPVPDPKGLPIYEGCQVLGAWPNFKKSVVRWLPVVTRVSTEARTDIELDFTVEPAGILTLRAYDTNGSRHVFGSDYPHYTTDLSWDVTPSQFEPSYSSFILTLNNPDVINLSWEVPGFGKGILRADNGGKGFTITGQGQKISINLNYELATTQFRLLIGSYQKYIAEGDSFSVDLSSQIRSANALWNDTDRGLGDVEKARLADLCLNRTLWATEHLELEKAAQDIEKYRKGNVTLSFLDEAGRPIPSADVAISETTHDFLFGASPDGPVVDLQAFRILTQAGINYGHFEFCWGAMDPLDQYLSQNPPSLFKSLSDMGLRLGGGCLFLLEAGPDTYGTGFLGLSLEQLKTKIYEHVYKIADQYSRYLHLWTVCHNMNRQYDTLGFSQSEVLDLVKTAIQAIRSIDQDSKVMLYIDDPAGDKSEAVDTAAYTYFSNLSQNGIELDGAVLGVEYGSLYEWYPGWGLYGGQTPMPFMDLGSISRMFDWYDTLPMPLHVEIHAPANFESNLGYWHERSWDQDLQAEWIRDSYTILFSKQLMREITYSYVVDGDYMRAGRGLLDVNHVPRESFYALKTLINGEWTTRLQSRTDSNGQVKFRGFAGNYTITIKTENGTFNSTIHVSEQTDQAYTIKIGEPSTSTVTKTEAEEAIANATEAVGRAKMERRTIFLDKAESLLKDSQKALSEENYGQATLFAEEAHQAADTAVTWLVIPVAIVFVGLALAVVAVVRRRRKNARPGTHA